TGQVQLAGPATVIDERDQAHFRVMVPRDTDGPRRLNVAVPAAELGPVGVEGDLVFINPSEHRLMPDRPDRAVLRTADVDELPPTVPGPVLPPAGHIQGPPGAGSGPRVGNHDTIRSVGQKRDLWVQCVGCRPTTRSSGWAGIVRRFVCWGLHL